MAFIGAPVIPASLVILFAVSVTKVKCILKSKVLLQCQVKIYYWEWNYEVKLGGEVKQNNTAGFNQDWTKGPNVQNL